MSLKKWISILGTLEALDGVNQGTMGDVQTLERRFSLQKLRPHLLSHTHWPRVQQPPHPQSACRVVVHVRQTSELLQVRLELLG